MALHLHQSGGVCVALARDIHKNYLIRTSDTDPNVLGPGKDGAQIVSNLGETFVDGRAMTALPHTLDEKFLDVLR